MGEVDSEGLFVRGTDPSTLPKDFADNKADLWQWNVNGLRAGVDKGTFTEFINTYKPQVIALNEIKLDFSTID